MTIRILQGDCRSLLATLPDSSAHCCVTSPPYFGLRDYGVDGQIGLEPTPAEYVEQMVAVFREVRRVLRDDGTLWLNLGDSYAGSRQGPQGEDSSLAGNGHQGGGPKRHATPRPMTPSARRDDHPIPRSDVRIDGLKAKDLIGVPWRVAFALQADGWWLRQDIIWHKPNPMPESVRDRCTKAHEYVFLLSKSERYYFDADAIAENAVAGPPGNKSHRGAEAYEAGAEEHRTKTGLADYAARQRSKRKDQQQHAGRPIQSSLAAMSNHHGPFETRNKRSVWTIATQPFSEAHFATMAPDLAEPCIKAGCRPGGTVLDPFGGAGTTGLVADRLQRDALLIELNPEYAALARRRIFGDAPLFANIHTESTGEVQG